MPVWLRIPIHVLVIAAILTVAYVVGIEVGR